MLQTTRSTRGTVVAPHHLAAQAGLRVLQDGGNAVEAMIAAAATIAVAYPHMNSLGGDNFWLIGHGDGAPVAIDACGGAAAAANLTYYAERGLESIPERGPPAALTVAGAVAGWQQALEVSARWGGRLPLARLLEDAVHYARAGVAVTRTLHENTRNHLEALAPCPGFAEVYLVDGAAPPIGTLLAQPRLADTLERLGRAGLEDFYRGELGEAIAADLERIGSPLGAGDLRAFRARRVTPLSARLGCGTLYNMPPPTQGLASVLILALFDRLGCRQPDGFDHVHGLVEATKCAFEIRDRHITDPDFMPVEAQSFLDDESLRALGGKIDRRRAAPWPAPPAAGDTVWLGAMDGEGRAVSFIQSVYWEFGSGVVLPATGIVWQNRGMSFSLEPDSHNVLAPRRRPFHTIHPAMAQLADGRHMVYGAMGGDGQPQTQAAVFTRYALYDRPLQEAVTAPRWVLGRTWGAPKVNLRIENRFPAEVTDALRAAGHDVELVGDFDELMGHAGAIVRNAAGVIEGAADPRSDGTVAAF